MYQYNFLYMNSKTPKFVFLARISCLNSHFKYQMNCHLTVPVVCLKRHHKVNMSKNKFLIIQPSLNLLFTTLPQFSQQQLHASNCLGNKPGESFLNFLSCLTSNSLAIPAQTGFETPKIWSRLTLSFCHSSGT